MADDLQDLGTTQVLRLDEEVNWRELPKRDFLSSRTILEFPGTAIRLTNNSENLPETFEFLVTFFSKLKEKEFLGKFFEFRGRYRRFWFPLPINRFTVTEDIIINSNAITVAENKFELFGHERLYLLLKNGDMISRQISSVGETTITLSSNITISITKEDIVMCSLMLLVRFDKDALDFTNKSPIISETRVLVRELIEEYGEA